ncbi:hypothetical protein ACFYOF_16965 [Streptomyces sp. NPDC007148]|uniref:hypothetical protein n=1 Tax=Streptomyces sp. NPDC007148 TaxID=3364775 RepID=UPI0036985E9F
MDTGLKTLMHHGRPAMPAACPGPCNNAWRKAEAAQAADGTEHQIAPAWGNPIHCQRCTDRAHSQLGELPELVVAIQLEAVNGTTPKATGTIGRTTAVLSWPGQASRILTDHIITGLLGLEDVIRAGRQLPARDARGREGVDLVASVTFLRSHLIWVLDRYPGETDPTTGETMDPAALIRQWHRGAEKFTRRDARLEHHPLPCPRCDLLTLFRADGENYIECRNVNCQTLLTPAEYHEHSQQLATAHRSLAAA